MRLAYLDCASGISGDMTLGALVDAGADLKTIQTGIDSLGLPSCRLATSEAKKRGFRATQITVEHEPEHKHRHLHHITAMIDGSTLSARAKELATRDVSNNWPRPRRTFTARRIEKVHFHEVGAVDSIADIVGSAIGFDLLGIDRFVFSPVPTGHGFVEIAHGRCSIPAPATAELLRGVPLAPLDVEGELTTPTGAAIVAALADDVGPLPAMTVERIGYGAGQKEFPQANLLRVLIGEDAATTAAKSQTAPHTEAIVLLETNLDNASGEEIGHAVERLWEAGAIDVTLLSIQMKKGRPGIIVMRSIAAGRCRPPGGSSVCGDANLGRAPLHRDAKRPGARGGQSRDAMGTDHRQDCLFARWLAAVLAGIRGMPPDCGAARQVARGSVAAPRGRHSNRRAGARTPADFVPGYMAGARTHPTKVRQAAIRLRPGQRPALGRQSSGKCTARAGPRATSCRRKVHRDAANARRRR